MNTKEFFNLLKSNKNKSLLFEYSPNKMIAPNYHITEVKHITIESVDCGANTDSWKETIIQLVESANKSDKNEFMTVLKALSILEKVGSIKPYSLDAELKFEFGNDAFHTAQLFVANYQIETNNLILKLAVEKTTCKAKNSCKPAKVNEKITESCNTKMNECC